jgi:WD40 repeat protein
MERPFLPALVGVLLLAGSAFAVDLTKIERAIVKAPTFKTQSPEYCLLVFGLEAEKRVWLIHDGDTLYVDRNSDGDLTEPDERVAAKETGEPTGQGVFYFEAGALPDTPKSHECLEVGWSKIDYLRENNRFVRAALDADPQTRGCFIRVDVAMADQHGVGVDGRVSHYVYSSDVDGLLQFAASPATAPILHFGGPWQVTLNEPLTLQAGQKHRVDVSLATPGLGAGSTVFVGYERVVPLSISPRLEVEYTNGSGDNFPLTENYTLTQRCCKTSLYDDVLAPEAVGDGTAKMKISLRGAFAFHAAPTVHEIATKRARPRPTFEPVSNRLKARLPFSQACSLIGPIQYSPDGKSLAAGGYPEGVVDIWNLDSRQLTTTIKSDGGLRSTLAWWKITADWKSLVALTNKPEVFERLPRDGGKFYRSQFDDAIELFDLPGGNRRRVATLSPPHGNRSLDYSATGGYFISQGYLPGEFPGRGPLVTTLWDESLSISREIGRAPFQIETLSADGRSAIVSLGPENIDQSGNSIHIFRAPEFKEVKKLLTAPPLSEISISALGLSDKVLLGEVRAYSTIERDYDSLKRAFAAWDVETGEELFSVRRPEKVYSTACFTSSDGKFVAVNCDEAKGTSIQLRLLNLETRDWKTARFSAPLNIVHIAFHPTCSWLAVLAHLFVKGEESIIDPEYATQPRIMIVDVATGEIIETLVAPHAQMISSAISPDGSTLATSGHNEVLLWDVGDIASSIEKRPRPAKSSN